MLTAENLENWKIFNLMREPDFRPVLLLSNTRPPHFIALCIPAPHGYGPFTDGWKGWGVPGQSPGTIFFPNGVSSLCVSVSPFGDSHGISNIPIIIVLVTVIGDQGLLLTESSNDGFASFSQSSKLRCVRRFVRHSALARLTDHGVA